jgi:hypothetical protein
MVQKFAPLVKRQVEYYLKQIAFYPPTHPRYKPQKIELYRDLVRQFGELLGYLNAQEGSDLQPEPPVLRERVPRRSHPIEHSSAPASPASLAPPASPAPQPIARPKDDLADLPAELLAELSGGAKGESDPLIQIINKHGGTATLDQILIDLYRDYGEVGKRTLVGNKLYRLGRRNLVWAIPGRKGIYTTTKPAGTDTAPEQDGDGAEAPETEPSAKSETSSSPPSGSSKTRRDLFASTAIPPNRIS